MIDKDILIEDLVSRLPKAVGYLMRKDIKCLACGEPIWGTLEQAAKEKGFSDDEIEVFVADLNALAAEEEEHGT
jgi:iron-sulfur cluster repair protein YtfE (RIC family)